MVYIFFRYANLTGEDQSKGGGIATTQNQSLVGGESALRLASSYNCFSDSSATSRGRWRDDGRGASRWRDNVSGGRILSWDAPQTLARDVEDAVAIGSASSVGAKGGVAIGAGATAGGALSSPRVQGSSLVPRRRAVFGDVASKDLVFLSERWVSTRSNGISSGPDAYPSQASIVPGCGGGGSSCFAAWRVVVGHRRVLRPRRVQDLLDVDEALPGTLCRRARDPRVFGVCEYNSPAEHRPCPFTYLIGASAAERHSPASESPAPHAAPCPYSPLPFSSGSTAAALTHSLCPQPA
eukprot:gene704-2133_t